MRVIVKLLLVVCLVFAWAGPVTAQADPLSAIQKICLAYNQEHAIRFSGSIKMYNKANPGIIIERIKSSYLLKGRNFNCSIGAIEMLVNDNYYVSVDKGIKMIMIGRKKDVSGTEQMPVLNTGLFEKWIREKTVDGQVILQGNVSIIQLTDVQQVTGYSSYRISYDTLTGYMKKVILELSGYNDPAHKTMVLEIDYTRPVMVESNRNTFSENPFFSFANNKVQVNTNYKTYQLINQL